jgi:hypothetical protein
MPEGSSMSAALAELETGWTAGGYHRFSLDRGDDQQRRERAGRGYPGELEREIPAHWQAMQ